MLESTENLHHPQFEHRLHWLRGDCLRLNHLIETQIRRHYLECPKQGNQEDNPEMEILNKKFGNEKFYDFSLHQRENVRMATKSVQTTNSARKSRQNGPEKMREIRKENGMKMREISTFTRRSASPLNSTQNLRQQRSHSVKSKPEIDGRLERRNYQRNQKHRTPTVPRPFRFTERPPIPCTFASRHLHEMLEAKRLEEEAALHRPPFKAVPIPATTYRPDRSNWIGQIRRKSKPRTKSVPPEKIRLGQPVPLSTYLKPSPSVDELRALRMQRQSVNMLAMAKAPRGMEEHSISWHVQQRLRHGLRCLASSPRPLFHAQSVPDFNKLQAEFEQKLAAHRHIRPSTVPRPFRLSRREYDGEVGDKLRGHRCENWTEGDRRMRHEKGRRKKI